MGHLKYFLKLVHLRYSLKLGHLNYFFGHLKYLEFSLHKKPVVCCNGNTFCLFVDGVSGMEVGVSVKLYAQQPKLGLI